jgi:2-polyprenyl-3-methyl-5-hydroxy-6-metoxy-1,4-benzoquinol methylase
MAEHVCPWWLGYFLIGPIRRLGSGSPDKILSPHVKNGMTVIEPGPGMGFFTLPMARMVGGSGRVVAIDIQPKMIEHLRRRADKAGLLGRIETRLTQPDSLGIADLAGSVDFVLAMAMVHETPSPKSFFSDCAAALKPGGRLLLAEPAGHVKSDRFDLELAYARAAGLELLEEPPIRRSLTALFVKPAV